MGEVNGKERKSFGVDCVMVKVWLGMVPVA